MGRTRRTRRTAVRPAAPAVVASPEFALATASAIAIVGLAGPLLVGCLLHLGAGEPLVGCSLGTAGLVAGGAGAWKLGSAVRRVRARFGATD